MLGLMFSFGKGFNGFLTKLTKTFSNGLKR